MSRSDIDCPYCGKGQEINHDEGYGYEEDVEHEQECGYCDKTFKFTTAILYHYTPICHGDHDWGENPFTQAHLIEKHSNARECKRCETTDWGDE